jgi:HlyD family secretion protein
MKSLLRIAVILLIVGGLLLAAWQSVTAYLHNRNRPQWRTAKVTVGKIVADVKSTGTVKPVLSVSIGSFVSGPVTELHADFNQFVKKGDLLARIDPRVYQANVDRGRAELASREAEVERARAQLLQAQRNEQRALALRKDDPDFISAKEMDSFHFERVTLEAQLKLAEAAVQQSHSSLANSITNLEYTDIVSPVDGMVTDCLISRGQTLAAQFQTPELFKIAPDMDKEMYIFASVDEADIGQIIQAQKQKLPVEFTIDAYPDDVFHGVIREIRKNYTTVENVVTYPVVVSAQNPDWKLLPGMTASLSFRVEEKEGVLRVPNSALRFYPDVEQVRTEDRDILLGTNGEEEEEEADSEADDEEDSSQLKRKKVKRHVWIEDGEFLKAVEIETGLTDLKHSEVLSGELKEGQKLVTGQKLTATTE